MKLILSLVTLLLSCNLLASEVDAKQVITELDTFKNNGNATLRKLESEDRYAEARMFKDRLQAEYNERQAQVQKMSAEIQSEMDSILSDGGSDLSPELVKSKLKEVDFLKKLIKREHYMIERMRKSLIGANAHNLKKIGELEEDIYESLIQYEQDVAYYKNRIKEAQEEEKEVLKASTEEIDGYKSYIAGEKINLEYIERRAREEIKAHKEGYKVAEQKYQYIYQRAQDDIKKLEELIGKCLNAECRDPLYRKKHEIQIAVANETYSTGYNGHLGDTRKSMNQHKRLAKEITEELNNKTYSCGYMCSMPQSLESISRYEKAIKDIQDDVKNRTYYKYTVGSLKDIDETILKSNESIKKLAKEKADGRYHNIGNKRREIEELRSKIALRIKEFNEGTWGPIVGMKERIANNQKKIDDLVKELGMSERYQQLETSRKALFNASSEVVTFEVIDPTTKLPLWFRTLQKAINLYDDVMEITRVKKIFDKVKDMNPFNAFDTFMREYGGKGIYEIVGEKILPKKWMKNEHVRSFFRDYDHQKLVKNLVVDGVNPLKKEMELLKAMAKLKTRKYRDFLEEKGSDALIKVIENSPKLRKMIELQEKLQAAKNNVDSLFDSMLDKSFSYFDKTIDQILQTGDRKNYVVRTDDDVVNEIREVERKDPERYNEALVKAYAKTSSSILKKEYGLNSSSDETSFKKNLIKEFR